LVKTSLTTEAAQMRGRKSMRVVLDDHFARLREFLCWKERCRETVDHPVVKADEGKMGLRDRKVLVVSLVRDQRLPPGLLRTSDADSHRAASRSNKPFPFCSD